MPNELPEPSAATVAPTSPTESALKASHNIIADNEIQAIRRKLIESNGDLDKASVSLELMGDIIYTLRMKANPMQDTPNDKLPKAAKAKRSEGATSQSTKLSGEDVNSFLG
jgi:hypothetical protein